MYPHLSASYLLCILSLLHATRPMQSRSKKYGLSCLVCRRRKVRCDGGRPSCANCLRLSERCHYNVQDPTVTRLQNALIDLESRYFNLQQNLRSLLVLEPSRCRDGLRQILAESDSPQSQVPEASSNAHDNLTAAELHQEGPSELTDETHEEVG